MRLRAFIPVALAVALVLAIVVSPFASSSPDGLEKVAQDKGFLDQGRLHSIQEDAPAPDYAFPGIEDERLATAASGLVGTLVVLAVGAGVLHLVRRRRTPA